jgi:hypothetical protein
MENEQELRKDWAAATADAIFNANVMNQCWLVYDLKNRCFSYQSSLTPLCDDEVLVDDDCSEDSYGIDISESTEEYVAQWLADDGCEDFWIRVVETIEDAIEEMEEELE